ncbi:MAG TPA: YeeE/YedE thiosulfate transporter family protein [Polyangiaceae bacterium]|nr:YeeE/YedE thiosulfate transporter family protein [Polyangiaceae bacterium]
MSDDRSARATGESAATGPRSYWNPYVAGFFLGLVLLASFVWTGKGLGASGAVNRVAGALLHALDPSWAEDHKLIGSFFAPGVSPFNSWIVYMFVGVLLGGIVGVVTGKRFKIKTIHGPRIGRNGRLVLALLGGILSGVAAQIGRGCTSGQALTGGAQLALGSWVYMFSVFGGAYALAWFLRKQWV